MEKWKVRYRKEILEGRGWMIEVRGERLYDRGQREILDDRCQRGEVV